MMGPPCILCIKKFVCEGDFTQVWCKTAPPSLPPYIYIYIYVDMFPYLLTSWSLHLVTKETSVDTLTPRRCRLQGSIG